MLTLRSQSTFSLFLCVSALSIAPAACGSQPDPATCATDAVEQELRTAMTTKLADIPANPGWLMALHAPERAVDLQIATPGLDPRAPFRIASIGKTFTSAATLRLVEDGRISLDDTVDAVVPAPLPTLLRQGGYDPARITVRQLLTHTAGLWDYAMSAEYAEAVFAAAARRWSRVDQVQFAMDHGHPEGRPGERYHYSDTGYILLGAIIERESDGHYAAGMRALLGLDKLGLQATWLESLEPAPIGAPAYAPQTFEEQDLFAFDASIDLWGGGGYVSTTRDLAQFYQALLTGQVFHHPETLKTMLTVPPTNTAEHAGMGIYATDGVDCWVHGGFWGTAAGYCPELGTGFAVAGLNPAALPGAMDLVAVAVKRQIACAE